MLEKALEVTASLYARYYTWWSNFRNILREDSKGWLICLAVLAVTVVRSSITYSFGVFVVQLENIYHAPLSEQNWIGTLSFCISLSCAPLSVAFIRGLKYRGYRYGSIIGTVILGVSCLGSSFVTSLEWMFLTHSLLYGVGSSLIYMASSLVIGEYFDKDHKYHVLATSVLLCGYPVGSLLFNPINAWLVTRFGWRVAFRCASGLILVFGLACSWTFTPKQTPSMRRLSESSAGAPESTHEMELDEIEGSIPRRCCTLQEIKNRPEIVLWYLGNMLSYLGFFMPFLNLAYYMQLKGIPTTKSSWALTLLSLAECVTYIIASFMGDYLKGKLVYVNVLASAALSIICIIWPFVDVSYSVILVIAIAMGGFLGLTIVYTYAASGEVTELPIDIAWSFTNLWSGMGVLIGPFFSGAIYDFRKSYDDVFYVVGALYVIDVVVFAAIPFVKRRRQQMESKTDYNEITGIVGDKQTFKITNRSVSKGSLANEENGGVGEYGTTAKTDSIPMKTPPPETTEAYRREVGGGYNQNQNQNQNPPGGYNQPMNNVSNNMRAPTNPNNPFNQNFASQNGWQ